MQPLRKKVTDDIRGWIVRGELPPGQRLIERELCERLGVSRPTLREAYRQLEAEGLLLMTPNKGPTVTVMSDREARSVYEVREALECFAIKLFVERASDDQVRELQKAVRAVRAAHRSGDVGTMLSVKAAFYEVLYEGAGNPTLTAQARVLNQRLALLRARSLSRSGRPKESIREIEDVCRFIERRQPEIAAAAWRDHIRSAAHAALGDEAPPRQARQPPPRGNGAMRARSATPPTD